MHRPVFICSGNICRSPLAAGLFMQLARDRGLKAFAISMGTLNITGKQAASNSIAVAEEVGVDISGHRSQGVSVGLLRHASEIFIMEESHRDALRRMDPQVARAAKLLGAYDPEGPPEISDPIGGPIEEFRACRGRIVRALEAYLDEVEA